MCLSDWLTRSVHRGLNFKPVLHISPAVSSSSPVLFVHFVICGSAFVPSPEAVGQTKWKRRRRKQGQSLCHLKTERNEHIVGSRWVDMPPESYPPSQRHRGEEAQIKPFRGRATAKSQDPSMRWVHMRLWKHLYTIFHKNFI